MKSIFKYVKEAFENVIPIIESSDAGSGTSDNALRYRIGKYKYEWMDARRQEALNKKYHINKNNFREKIVQWQKETSFPFMPDENEIIHRKDWELETLNGVTEEALNHKHYDIWWDYIYKHHKPKHDILTVFECSNAKPYFYALPMRYYTLRFSKWTDFASIDYGIQPWEYVNYYPSRWDEWDHGAEDEHMAELYSEKTKKRILEFHKHFKYKKIIFICQNNHPQRPVNELWKDNTNNFRDWAVILTDDDFRKKFKQANPSLPAGLATSRTIVNDYTHKKYAELLAKCVGKDQDEIKEAAKLSKSEAEKAGYVNPFTKAILTKCWSEGKKETLPEDIVGPDDDDEEDDDE